MGRALVQRCSSCRCLLLIFVLNLYLVPSLHAQGALTPPQIAVGGAIQTLCPPLSMVRPKPTGSTGDLLDRCTEVLVNADPTVGNQGAVPNPLLQMTSKEVSSQGTKSVETSTLQFANVATRISELRRGVSGVSLLGIALRDPERAPANPALASLWPGQDGATMGEAGVLNTFPRFETSFAANSSQPMLAQAGSSGSASAAGANPFGRLGVFVNGIFGFGDKDATSREAGFDFDTYGVTGGVDYRIKDNLVGGVAFGYTHTDDDYASSRGNMDANSYTFSVFGTYYVGQLYVDGIFNYSWNDFDSSRNIVYSIPQ